MSPRPHTALKAGRYALDRDGKLHPLRRRYWVDVVAVVHVKPLRSTKRPCEMDDGREQMIAEAARTITAPPAPAPAPAPAPVRKAKLPIDLNQVPSSMEQRAASWRGKT